MSKERFKYELLCPCGYHYQVEAFEEPKWEICPMCGLSANFKLFLVKGEDKSENPIREAG